MIICPYCKEEIESGSHFCDQCGKLMMYCMKCGHVGTGRRCTSCGGMMATAEEIEMQNQHTTMSEHFSIPVAVTSGRMEVSSSMIDTSIPQLKLVNRQLNIDLVAVNGAVIGRRQGPYRNFKRGEGWVIMDKHSSNGSWLNKRKLVPDVAMTLNNGDVLTIANVNLQVVINSTKR